MARKTSTLPTRIWKFGAQPPTMDVRDILWHASRYYNRLVEIERRRSDRFQAIRREHAPDLAAAEDAYTVCDDAIEALYAEAKRERADHYRATNGEKTRSLPPEYADRKKLLDAERKCTSEAAKPLRVAFNARLTPDRDRFKEETAARANGGGPQIKSRVNAEVLLEMLGDPTTDPVWRAIAQSDDLAQRERKTARSECGLAHGTYLKVEEAVDRAKKDSAPRQPSFRRYEGSGKIVVQLHGETWSDILAGSSTFFQLQHSPREGARGDQSRYYTARIRIGSNEDRSPIWCTFSVKLHRQPPSDAVVKWAWLLVRRVGERLTYELQVTMEHASFADPKRPTGIGHGGHVRIGWATVHGGVRVATTEDAGPVIVPELLLRRGVFADRLRSHADDHYNTMLRVVRRWMAGGPNRITTWHRLRKDRDRLTVRRVCEQFARHRLGEDVSRTIWRDWVASRPRDLFPSLVDADRWIRARGHAHQDDRIAWWLYCWARKDAHLRQVEADTRRKFERARDAVFRDAAIRIATKHETITVDSYSIAWLKEREPLTMPGEAPQSPDTRLHLQYAAPGRFREILREAMGPRCTPCERPCDDETPGTARKPKKRTKSGGSDAANQAVAIEATSEAAE
jgi:hypothetical protein